ARARHRPAEVREIHRVGEHLLEPRRRLLAGGVGVEEGDDFVGVTAEEPELRVREGGAEGGDRLDEAVLMRHEAVEVTLDDDRAVLLAHGRARNVERVERLSLHVEWRLRRVEVLRLLARERTTAEGDDAALRVADGKEEPAAEAVVEAGARLARQ